jgi:hypothetical protein
VLTGDTSTEKVEGETTAVEETAMHGSGFCTTTEAATFAAVPTTFEYVATTTLVLLVGEEARLTFSKCQKT